MPLDQNAASLWCAAEFTPSFDTVKLYFMRGWSGLVHVKKKSAGSIFPQCSVGWSSSVLIHSCEISALNTTSTLHSV